MSMNIEYDQALAIIRRLDRPTRARLIAQMAQELVSEPVPSMPVITDPRQALAEIREHFAKLGPIAPEAAEQLEHDRQQRANLLEGNSQE